MEKLLGWGRSPEAAAQQKQPGGISNYPECLIENFLKSSVRAIHDSIIWQLCPEYFDGKQDDDDGLYIWGCLCMCGDSGAKAST